jgi:hypothetical protein
MKASTKKALIWSSVIVAAGVGGYFAWKYLIKKDGTTDEDTDTETDTETSPDDYSSGGKAVSDPVDEPAPVTAGANFRKLKKFFGKGAKDYGNKIVVKKTPNDFAKTYSLEMGLFAPFIKTVGQNWGVKSIIVTFYKSGKFFVKLEGMDTWIISGTYGYGGKKMRVVDAKGKWKKNIGLKVEGNNPASNVQKLLTNV